MEGTMWTWLKNLFRRRDDDFTARLLADLGLRR
jgi:hypothetical protein